MEEEPEQNQAKMSVDDPAKPLNEAESDEEVFIVMSEPGSNEEKMATDDPSDVSQSEEEIFMVDKIVDVKAFVKEKTVKYRVRWEGFGADDDTWEQAESLTESPLVAKSISEFRENHRAKVEKEEAKLKGTPKRSRSRRRQTWEYVDVDEEPNRSDLTNPRELDEADEFYGEIAGNVKGEAKRLFDPDHKNSPTELLLSQNASSERFTRRQMKELLPGGSSEKDSESPTSSSMSSPAIHRRLRTQTKSTSPARERWDYVEVNKEPNRSDLTNPRELDKADEFYGEIAANVKGEAKKLFDPDHKNSPRELMLSQLATDERLTRRQVNELLPDETASNDSESPTLSKSVPAVSKLPVVKGRTRRKRTEGSKKDTSIVTKTSITAKDSACYQQSSQHVDQTGSTCRKRAASPSQSESHCSSDGKSDESIEINGNKQCDKLNKTFAGIPIHKGDIDLSSIQREYQEILRKMTTELDPEDYRFGREFIKLLSSGKTLDPYAIENLFKKMSFTQLQGIIHWKEEGSGGSILHWVCSNLACDSAHVGDQITHILCAYWKPVPGSGTMEHMIHSRDSENNTPLHIAVKSGVACRVNVLLNHRTCLHGVNRLLKTPLMIAYENNDSKMVRRLLHAGADFHNLHLWAMRQPRERRSKEALDEIARHSEDINKLLIDSRKKVLGPLEEVEDYYSPVRLSPFREAPILNFQIPHKYNELPSDDYMYMLALHVCSFDDSDSSQWSARCWGGLKQKTPPIFNGRDLRDDRAQDVDHPMLFFVDPEVGDNWLEVQITPNEVHYDILACQLFLVRPVPDYHNEP